jgi:hypothetical protein
MREMRHIVDLFSRSRDFDEQWILFKAYLNTAHSLSDNDSVAKVNFHQNELMNFALVLRNILHHQPAKWHFGKHDVQPASMSFNYSQNAGVKLSAELSLVIQKNTLEGHELQQILGAKFPKQLAVLRASPGKINSHVIIVLSLMREVQAYVEQYCKNQDQYTERYDNEPNSYTLIHNV